MSNLRRAPPLWKIPVGTETPIHVYNSLTKTKSPLILTSDTLKWYTCGPTPYDDAHLGHARNYVMTDVLRRILRDYFGIKIQFVMNVTDIDDKIILRARQRHLLRAFKQSATNSISTIQSALRSYASKNLQYNETNASSAQIHQSISSSYGELLARDTTDDAEAKQKMYARTATGASKAATAIERSEKPTEKDQEHLDDILSMHLDATEESLTAYNYAEDHTIFTELAQEYERRFTEDMTALNVLDPDEVTRVSEYIPQVVSFVQKIEEKGFAYQTATGVYFDVGAFERADNHYARLEPTNRNNSALQAEGEGAISGKQHSEKRDPADFALWKFSKPREPSWQSPWGGGRPGWHIECSAMASDKLGNNLDIHSGGIDLAFPHHDNELAQSEAYWTQGPEHQWVNYFLHTGHLSIAGAKMSKSLKNFTKIRDALQDGTWTSRGLRIALLQGAWREGIEITDAVTRAGAAWEDKVNNFFLKAKEIAEKSSSTDLSGLQLNDSNSASMLQPADPPRTVAAVPQSSPISSASSLDDALGKAKLNVFVALSDSFSTATVMSLISELITFYNSADPPPPDTSTLNLARWITGIVNMLGLNGTASPTSPTIGWSGLDIPSESRPVLTAISTLRDTIRAKARSPKGLTKSDIEAALSATSQTAAQLDPSQPFTKVFTSFHQSLRSLAQDESLNSSTDGKALSKAALALSDSIRDTSLWNLGIYLEDPPQPSAPALIRPVTRELRAQRHERETLAVEKARAKEAREVEARRKEKELEEKAKVPAEEMFKVGEYEGVFGEWEEGTGMPKRDKEGAELGKSRVKKLQKEWSKQKKLHEEYLAKKKA